jgi:hypothetical protein
LSFCCRLSVYASFSHSVSGTFFQSVTYFAIDS